MSSADRQSATRLVFAAARLGASSFGVLVCVVAGLLALLEFAELEMRRLGPPVGYGMDDVWLEAPWKSAIVVNAAVVGALSAAALVCWLRRHPPVLILSLAAAWLCVAAVVWARLKELPAYPEMVNTDKLHEWMLSVPLGLEMF